MKHIVTIKPTKTFEIVSNDNDLGIFKITSKWHGMIEMTRIDDGSTIVIQPEKSTLTVFDRMFLTEDIEQEGRIITVDPALWEQIKSATK
tara:strand:- start:125 stop:394 length:270 start_codon:yes stop_codon:yes gene_type:complete